MTRVTTLFWLASGILLGSCSSGPAVLYQDDNGLVVLESETWTTNHDSNQYSWVKSSSGNTDIVAKLDALPTTNDENSDSNQHPTAVYEIRFNEAGLYYVWVRAKLTTANAKPVLTLIFNSSAAVTALQIAEFSDQWQWIPLDIHQNLLAVNVDNADKHELRITTNTTTLLVDKIILASQPDYLPVGNGPNATLADTAPVDSGSDNAPLTTEPAAGESDAGVENDGDEEATPTDMAGAPENPTIINDPVDLPQPVNRVNAQPQVTILYANSPASNAIVSIADTLQLVADATDDGLPTNALHTYWTKVSGPGAVEFSDQAAGNPTIRFGTPGTYTLQVSANDTELYRNAMITVKVESNAASVADSNVTTTTESITPPDNTATDPQPVTAITEDPPPVISIVGSTTADTGANVELKATTTDSSDNTLHYFWNLVHGSGAATFEDNQKQSTNVSFDQPGQYVVQVSASNTSSYVNATISIEVTGEAAGTVTDKPDPANNQNSSEPQTENATEDSQVFLTASNIGSARRWHPASSQGSAAKRHETSGVAVNGKMYVIGGRGHQAVDVYDSATNTWSQAARPPLEMHHFQAVAIDHIIYVVGAATCCFPVEINIPDIYQFDTIAGTWSKGAAIPGNRLRGSTAAAVYNKKIYIVGGNTKGHSGGAVSWFDEFNPATGQWRSLADAPDARDHATIAIVGDKLVVAGGRRSSYPNTFGNTVGRTNIYDLKQQHWQTAADIPTQRAGTMAVGLGSELVVIGGESLASGDAHNAVEAFDIFSGTWRRLSSLPTPRHGGAAAVINNQIHVVAGSKQRGGAPETDAHEILK